MRSLTWRRASAGIVIAAVALAGCSSKSTLDAGSGPAASSNGTVLSPMSAPCSKVTSAAAADQPSVIAGYATSMGFPSTQANDPATVSSVGAACAASPTSSVGSVLKGTLCTTKSSGVSTTTAAVPDPAADPAPDPGAVSDRRLPSRTPSGIVEHPARAGGGHGGGKSSGGSSSGGGSHSSGGGSSSGGSSSSGSHSSGGGSSSSGGSGSSGSSGSSSQNPCR